MSSRDSAVAEVERLHADLEAWIGRGDASRWQSFETALAEDFVQIGPDGIRRDRAAVLALVKRQQGASGDRFSIRIEDGQSRQLDERFALVTYREVQRGCQKDTDRWSSALLGRSPIAGWQWHHLHECWIV